MQIYSHRDRNAGRLDIYPSEGGMVLKDKSKPEHYVLKIREVADLFEVSYEIARGWIEDGIIRAMKFNSEYRIERHEVMRLWRNGWANSWPFDEGPPEFKAAMEERHFFEISDLARLSRFSVQTVRKWIEGGELKATRMGRKYTITRNELARFWEWNNGDPLFISWGIPEGDRYKK